MPFPPHGLTRVNFHLHRMEITKLLHITFRFHRTDYRNCSVYTARNTIVPFTPHGLTKVNGNNKTPPYHFPFSPHGLSKLLRLHRTEYNCAIYTAWVNKSKFPFTQHGNNKTSPYHFPFSPHGLQKLLRLHRTEYNCAIYTAWLNET